MPRIARIKSYDAVYHVMCKSIKEVNLFEDDGDKLKYLYFIRKYQKLYEFRVYAYCLMDNHAHFIIDANGSDISRIMHSINFSYAQYFNKIHQRNGHLFQDRFKSKVVEDERYLYNLSAYIHNNPTDIKGYEKCPQNYKFSSLSVYLGLNNDPFEIVDDGFIISLFGRKNVVATRRKYLTSVFEAVDEDFKKEVEFIGERTEYRSYRRILIRNVEAEKVFEYVSNKTGIDRMSLYSKYKRNIIAAKALLVVILRCMCNLKCKDICDIIGNVTSSDVSRLTNVGLNLINENIEYKSAMKEFLLIYGELR
ncbi:MAG: transposase [Caloramator sp.]|nr:transposase [Caloramator sp.]